eukprot:Em0015g446a
MALVDRLADFREQYNISEYELSVGVEQEPDPASVQTLEKPDEMVQFLAEVNKVTNWIGKIKTAVEKISANNALLLVTYDHSAARQENTRLVCTITDVSRKVNVKLAGFYRMVLLMSCHGNIQIKHIALQGVMLLPLHYRGWELHDMFVDLAIVVDEQCIRTEALPSAPPAKPRTDAEEGEIVDRIEYHVETASVHVDQGRKALKQAVSIKRSTNKKKFLIICIVSSVCGCISLIVVLVIVIVVALWKTNRLYYIG